MDVRSFFGKRASLARARRAPRRKAATAAVKSLKPRARKAVAAIAKSVMKRGQETKYRADIITSTDGPQMIYADVVPTGAPVQLFPALPDLAIGDNGFQRDGQRVNPVKHSVDLDFTFNNQIKDISNVGGLDQCAWDITVHVWYGYAKRYKSQPDVATNLTTLANELFELGDGSSGTFAGAPYDALKKINDEVFSLKHKKFRMYRSFGMQNQATLAGGITTYFPQLIKKRCTVSFKPPKTLMYDEANAYPENYAPIIIIGYEHNDNTQGANAVMTNPPTSILNAPALQVSTLSKLWFKDS